MKASCKNFWAPLALLLALVQPGAAQVLVGGTDSTGAHHPLKTDGSGGSSSTPQPLQVDVVQTIGGGGGGAVTQGTSPWVVSGTFWPYTLGQQLAAASVPMVLTAAQLAALTPPAAITGFATAAKQPSLGVLGTPSTDVITVQGGAGGTPVIIQGAAADGVASSGNPILGGGLYHSGADTYANGQTVALHFDSAGNLKTTRADLAAGEDLNFTFTDSVKGVQRVEVHGTPAHISTNATTVVKSGAGFLHTITICTKGASSNTATVYDNTAGSGTVLAVIDTTSSVTTLTFDDVFSTGLTIVTATGTAADLNVSYR